MILEYVLSAAGVARGWSATLDSMLGGAIRNTTVSLIGELPVGEHSHFVSSYIDLVALAIVLVIMVVIVSGARVSIRFIDSYIHCIRILYCTRTRTSYE